MGILRTLKSLLGVGTSRSDDNRSRDVGITVEQHSSSDGETTAVEGDEAESMSGEGVKPDSANGIEMVPNDDSTPAAAGTDAGGSTSSITETPDDPETAAEPAEAAGPTENAAAPTTEKTSDTDADSIAGDSADEQATTDDDSADEQATTDDDSADEQATADDDSADEQATADDDSADEQATTDDDSDVAKDDSAGESVTVIKGIGPAYGDRLAGAGIETVEQLTTANASELAEQTDISETRIDGWIERASVR